MPGAPIFKSNGRLQNTQGAHIIQLDDLQQLSPLHTLVLSAAPLDTVRLVYNSNPAAMKKYIFHDACKHSTNPKVIAFLKELVTPDAFTTETISKIMLRLLEGGPLEVAKRKESFCYLCTTFPEAMLYTRVSPRQGMGSTRSLTPLSRALSFDVVPPLGQNLIASILVHMISCIPTGTKALEIHASRGTNAMDGPRSAFSTKVNELTSLLHLELSVWNGDEVDQELLSAICRLVVTGPLDSLTIERVRSDSFLMPLFDALGSHGSVLTKLKLQVDISVAVPYLERMVKILKGNTILKDAKIMMDVYPSRARQSETLQDVMKSSLQLEALYDTIWYYEQLNSLGRDVMRDLSRPMMDIVVVLAQAIENHGSCNTEVVSFLYGLLRESPGKWSGKGVAHGEGHTPSGTHSSIAVKASGGAGGVGKRRKRKRKRKRKAPAPLDRSAMEEGDENKPNGGRRSTHLRQSSQRP